ncbi:nickel/cobalt efflux transporter [Ancylobacter lacus]|uniref:nickel/cobalt efflux transporter n=1 Tax=Ancylobacter lacus TaxID=2579970 RepID=UPI001BCF286F|nr:nickel/cobalt efflux transporter [Ancylobacter lacus]MBS7539597.1 nickel/cobalt efflux transporter RcnA [Ancylobacter lacus]
MPSFAELLQQGAAHAWLFIPSAILLGALHGLEPGHSKTLMAAFIVAVRGTVGQAVLLGLAATVSHTAVVWGIALTGMYLWQGLDVAQAEPWLQIGSAVIILSIAGWMLWRTAAEARAAHDHHDHDAHDHPHPEPETRAVASAGGRLVLELHEDASGARWRLRRAAGPAQPDEIAPGVPAQPDEIAPGVPAQPDETAPGVPGGAPAWPGWPEVRLETRRPDGARQAFDFQRHGDRLESRETIPEPHAFAVQLTLGSGAAAERHDLTFTEPADGHHHGHHHGHAHTEGREIGDGGWQDAHERAHAADLRRRFAGGQASTGQIVLFGLTGGLMPCPAAVTVLLLCLQLRAFALGSVLVLCFSIGLAVTMVSVGVVAALGVRHAGARWAWFGGLARRAPYVSGVLIALVGVYVGVQGFLHLPA